MMGCVNLALLECFTCSSKELAPLNGWRQESLHYLPYVRWAETSVLCSPGSKACEGDATLWKTNYWFERSAFNIVPKHILTHCNRRVFKISVCLCLSWHAINHVIRCLDQLFLCAECQVIHIRTIKRRSHPMTSRNTLRNEALQPANRHRIIPWEFSGWTVQRYSMEGYPFRVKVP